MRATRIVIGAAAALALVAAPPAAPAAQGWGVAGGDVAGTWRSPAVSAQAPALVPGWPGPSALLSFVAPDGALRRGEATPFHTASLNPDGTLRALLPVAGLAAIGPDGRLYGVAAGRVAAYMPSGDLIWSVPKPGMEVEGVRVLPAPDGNVYLAGEDGSLTALDASGRTRWGVGYFPGVGGHAVGPDGTVFYGTSAWSLPVTSEIVARRPDGEILWTRPVAGGVSRIAVADDGSLRVLSGVQDRVLSALAPDGGERWSLPVASAAMALGADGTAYLPVGGSARRVGGILPLGALRAVGPDGTVRWTAPARLDGSNPVVGGDGTIYVGGSPMVALRPDGSRAWSFPATSDRLAPKAIAVDGTLYVTAGETGRDLALAGPSARARVRVPRLSTQRALLARVRVSPTRFRLRGSESLCPTPGGPCRPAHPLGAVLSFSLTRDGAVLFVVRRARDGKVVSRVVRRAHPGISWRLLSEAADSQPLGAGRYTLTVRAAAGRTRATAGPLGFTVLPPRA
jgi:outer membrane protein assembly factor BamB